MSSEVDGTLYAEAPPAASIAPSGYASEGSASIDFSVTLDRAPNAVATINAHVTDGSAVAGQDYVVPAPQITFQPGQTWATFSVVPMADSNREWTEDFVVTLAEDGSGTSRVDPNWSTGTGEIVDDDAVTITVPEIIQVNNDDDNGNNAQDMEESGSVSGEDDLVLVTLAFPQENRAGATLTLGVSGTDKVKVWADQSRSQLLIGPSTSPSVTWTMGGSTIVPTMVYAEAIAPSATEGDVVLTFEGTDATATPQAPQNPTTSSSQDSTATWGLWIYSNGQDVTSLISDILIGQMAGVSVTARGPDGWVATPTYQWTVEGDVLKDYVIAADASTAATVPLAAADLEVQSPAFFWKSTPSTPKFHKVRVSVGNIGPAASRGTYERVTTFDVYEPTSTGTAEQGTAGFSANGTEIGLFTNGLVAGMSFDAMVEVPAPFAADSGEWHFVQLWNRSRQVTTNEGDVLLSQNFGAWGLDNWHPYPAPADDPYVGEGWRTGPAAHQTFDTPRMSLLDVNKQTSMDDVFTTYLMFKPGGATSEWVPLRKVQWDFHVGATKNAGVWQLDGNPGQSMGEFARTAEAPVWTRRHSHEDIME